MTGRVVSDARALLASLPDASVGLVITDPPIDLAGAGRFDLCAPYPRLSAEEIAAVLEDAKRVLVPGGHLYVWAPAGAENDDFRAAMRAAGWRFIRELAWDKGTLRGLGAYRNAWEPWLIYSNGPSRGFEKTCEVPSLLKFKSAIEARTAKPWPLYKVFMEMSSREGELVVDPFCGTNPLGTAARYVVPPRRWLAGDIFTEAEVDAQVKDRRWQEAGGTGAAARLLRTDGERLGVVFDG